MDTPANGHPAADHRPTVPNPKQPTVDELIDAQTKQIVGIMVRGLLVSSPGITPERLAASIARVTGEILGLCLVGDLVPVMMLRKTVKDAFVDAITKAPIVNPNAPPPKLNG